MVSPLVGNSFNRHSHLKEPHQFQNEYDLKYD